VCSARRRRDTGGNVPLLNPNPGDATGGVKGGYISVSLCFYVIVYMSMIDKTYHGLQRGRCYLI
jgi:hypothetical protein